MLKVTNLFIAGVLFAVPAFADISVGYLSILADGGPGNDQELTINNFTGQGACSPDFPACTNLSFTNWALTVNYASSYYNSGGGPSEPTPFVYTDVGTGPFGGFGDINAGGSLAVDFDLCGATPGCGSSPATTITSVEFSGQISPATLSLCDNSVPGCSGPNPDTFFANPNFDLVWNAASPGGSPYVDETNTYAQSPDITVTSQGSLATPEPNQYFAIAAILCALFTFRSKFYKRA